MVLLFEANLRLFDAHKDINAGVCVIVGSGGKRVAVLLVLVQVVVALGLVVCVLLLCCW